MINEKNILERANKIIKSVNKILRENKSINEEPVKMNANEKFIEQSWKSLKNKTKVFETIPLIYAVSDKDDLSADEMIVLLNKPYDWDPSGKEWLVNVLKKIKKDSKAFDTFKKVVIGGTIEPGAPSLKDLYNGEPVSGFIHNNITKFYSKLKSASKYNEKSKTFTADVVLLWGEGTVQGIFQGNLLKGMKPDAESLIRLSDDKTIMACVSLKALEGRVGKVTTLFMDKFGTQSGLSQESVTEETIDEGVMDLFKTAVSKVKDAGSSVIQKVKEYATDFKEWVKDTKNELTDIFTTSSEYVSDAQVEVKEMEEDAEDVLQAFDQEIVEHLNRSGKPITEATDDEPIQVSVCFRDKILTWYSKFDNNTKKYNTVFTDFQKIVSEYSTKNFFRLRFESIDIQNKQYKEKMREVEQIIKRVKIAKEKTVGTTGKKQKCQLLFEGSKPLAFTRKELKNMLMSNANFVAISMLHKMVEDYLKQTNKKNTKDAITNLVKFATQINAEAIFGGAIDVPLIKYNGKVIVKYGSRDKYEDKHTKNMVEYFNSAKTIPIIGLKITPSSGKTGEIATYYNITIFCLSDYKGSVGSKPKDSDFIYNEIAFKCNSGSEFTFAVEADKTRTGDNVTKIFMG
jgi:hypothetical protein